MVQRPTCLFLCLSLSRTCILPKYRSLPAKQLRKHASAAIAPTNRRLRQISHRRKAWAPFLSSFGRTPAQWVQSMSQFCINWTEQNSLLPLYPDRTKIWKSIIIGKWPEASRRKSHFTYALLCGQRHISQNRLREIEIAVLFDWTEYETGKKASQIVDDIVSCLLMEREYWAHWHDISFAFG